MPFATARAATSEDSRTIARVSAVVDAEARLEQLDRLMPTSRRPPADVLAEIRRDGDAYESALDRFAADGKPERALRIAVRLSWHWLTSGRLAEGQKRLLELLDGDGAAVPTDLRAQTFERAGTFAFERGATDEAQS